MLNRFITENNNKQNELLQYKIYFQFCYSLYFMQLTSRIDKETKSLNAKRDYTYFFVNDVTFRFQKGLSQSTERVRKEPSSKSGRTVLLPTRLLSSDTHSFFMNQSLSPSVFFCQLSAQYKKIVTNSLQQRCHYRTQCKHVMLIALELVHCKIHSLDTSIFIPIKNRVQDNRVFI